jgi:parvulin-like peptidyl-prolyl isomerase
MFYYWGQFYQLYSQYGNTLSYMGLDMKKPFEDQKFDETRTWADFFTDYALMQWTRDVAISEAVAKEGYTLSEAQKGQLQAMLDNLETDATKAGYANGEEYLKHAFDLSVDVESYIAYTTTSYINSSYLSSKYKEFQEEGKVNPGNHKDVYYIDIRHVLIKFADSTEGAKTAAKKEAEALYEAFKQNPTMDAFAAMAKEHSDDNANGTGGSAANGGLIEKVYPGQMVENFDKWCFAADRKAGDHGLVETEYGWHLMYFDGFNEQIFMTAAQSYAEEKYGAWEEDLFKQFALTDFRDKITFRHAK